MVSTSPTTVPTVLLQGPFWQADVEVVQLADPSQNHAFRSLWLERHPGSEPLYLPGTLILLGCVRRVTVTPTTAQHYRWQRSPGLPPAAELPDDLRNALATGALTLLLVQADPQLWPTPGAASTNPSAQAWPPLTCLAGDIALGTFLSPLENATERLYNDLAVSAPAANLDQVERRGVTRLRTALSAHSSGLSLYGAIDLPWQPEPLKAALQLAQTFSPRTTDSAEISSLEPGPFRLTLEVERLTATERQNWIHAWQKLSQYLTPRNPLNGPVPAAAEAGPHWVTLEVTNSTAIPNLFWEIHAWGQDRRLNFASDSFNLILSNQSLYDADVPPTSLGRIALRRVEVRRDGELLILEPEAGPPAVVTEAGAESGPSDYAYHYQASPPAEALEASETVTLSDLTLAFDPVAVPEFLRVRQGQLPPATGADTLAAPVLWGFMPLEQGWFQLPIPNLTEQIYLDNSLARPLSTSSAPSLLQGAVSLGNDNPKLLKTYYPSEQPWNLVLTNVAHLSGKWTLTPTGAAGYRLSEITLRGQAPELVLNGLFWLSTGRPLAQEALPELDNWVSGVRSHPLRTVRDTDLFPAAVVLQLANLTLSARALSPSHSEPKPVVAALGPWSFSYEVNRATLGALVEKKVLPANTFSQFLPWVWQHHGTLPMVQALPLTQTQLPPNYPSANRQLVPFELGVQDANGSSGSIASPQSWRFEAPGAGAWPQPVGSAPGAREWTQLFDLPLVSLSLPGLVLDPGARETGLAADFSLNLPTQYRFDLPYTDEPNALAQLPEPPQDAEAVSPLPTSPRPQPPRPLQRPTFIDQWQQLAEQASLASADAVAALATDGNGGAQVQALVEPFVWPVQASLDLTIYPGYLSLANQDNANGTSLRLGDGEAIALTGLSALAGISGRFSQNGTDYTLVAGSLLASGGLSGLRDQRGLERSASDESPGPLLRTPVSLELEPAVFSRYELTTTQQPLWLRVGDRSWQLWFRDLPMQVEAGAALAFNRQHTRSTAAEDVNDPNAFSRRHNVLTGYEWRLGEIMPLDTEAKDEAEAEAEPQFLPVFQLHFYPLTLEAVTLDEGQVQTLRLVGRLQLPLSAKGEAFPDLSSEVEFAFERDSAGTLGLSAVNLAVERDSAGTNGRVGVWPLAPESLLALPNNATTGVPQLTWGRLSLETNASTGAQALSVEEVWLNFFLFDQSWALPLAEPLVFPEAETQSVEGVYPFPSLGSAAALAPRHVALTLSLVGEFRRHSASLRVDLHLGQMVGAAGDEPTFRATVEFPLIRLGEGEAAAPVQWESASLFNQLSLTPGPLTLNRQALEFEWHHYELPQEALYFLPGMALKAPELPGFAALTFAAQERSETDPDGAQYPDLQLATAFLETILTCQWGKSLHSRTGATPPGEVEVSAAGDRIFAPAAGDLVIGYTSQWLPPQGSRPGGWADTLLLNGFLEVTNLISWPLELKTHAEVDQLSPAGVVLPALPAADQNGWRSLSHLRHSLRVLLNQHSLPVEQLALGAAGQVFKFQGDRPWQLLAVTEHQLLAVFADSDSAYRLGQTRRWTTTQTVRLMPVGGFRTFLSQSQAQTVDPARGSTPLGEASLGLWNSALQAQLLDTAAPALDAAALGEAALGAMLMVEASAPHWLRTSPVVAASPTTLQFLPNGSQLGILSNPADYGPSDPHDPHWLLLNMPFWGRLLSPTSALEASTNPLQRDPLALLADGEVSDLALALTSWAATDPLSITLTGFDTATGRTWPRLDPLSLEESWFRLNQPRPETPPTQMQSILSARPSTSARLSRSTALGHAFDPLRLHYPPVAGVAAPDTDGAEPAPSLLSHPERSRAQSIRADLGLQVLYTFQRGEHPDQVQDVSGVGEPINLTIAQPSRVTWLEGGGLQLTAPTMIASNQPPNRLIEALRDDHEITVEVWVKPASTGRPDQLLPQPAPGNTGPARIVTLSHNIENRFFTLGQEASTQNPLHALRLRLRTTLTDNNGISYARHLPSRPGPTLVTAADFALRPQLMPIIFTRRTDGTTRLYTRDAEDQLRFVELPSPSDSDPGSFDNWVATGNQRFDLVLGNERGGAPNHNSRNARPWLGEFHLVAIYNQALAQAEVEALVQQGSGTEGSAKRPPYSWHQTALQLKTSGLFPTADQAETGLIRHAAATLLPARLTVNGQPNPRPLSLAVSPYLGLEFQPAPQGALTTQLASVELLCLEAGAGSLQPVASALLDRELLEKSATSLEQISQQWANDTHQRLTPESPIAVLRYREILATDNQEVVTRYRFQVLSVQQPGQLAQRVFALGSDVHYRRFQSGQFGGQQMPITPRSFELAPPQTTGVQPLYLQRRPPVAPGPEPEPNLAWPWGLSGLRLSVQYSDHSQPALGSSNEPAALWWQAPNYAVQYRSSDLAQSDLPMAGLPAHYRPGAIKTLLPVLPSLPMPTEDAIQAGDGWQPVLPGQLRYLLTGNRPGVMVVIRNQLLKQTLGTAAPLLISGSVPVQHRVPRPVPLPANTLKDRALQPWASYFEPDRTVLATAAPADEAFFAESDGSPAQRLQLQMRSPIAGAISPDWNGQLLFWGSSSSSLESWEIELQLVDGLQSFTYQAHQEPDPSASDMLVFHLPEAAAAPLRDALDRRAAGDTLRVVAQVKPQAAQDNFWQTLSFPLRVVDPEALPLPLRPTFIHFEDPEYNRQLVSNAATDTATVLVQEGAGANAQTVSYDVTLACDRQEYNPESILYFRYDWTKIALDPEDQSSTSQIALQGQLSISHINAAGIVTHLNWPQDSTESQPAASQLPLRNDTLASLYLVNLQAENRLTLNQGDILELKLLELEEAGENVPVSLDLSVVIVAAPVIPVPQAAYGLLRRILQTAAPEAIALPSSVQCVRFAWAPAATRIELISAADLRTGLVRRRAVFQWHDTTRPLLSPEQQYGYAVQKITQTGSTHLPTFEPAS